MAKRSCDFCVQRKTRCDNGHPCRKCLEARPPLECTYLKPVLKRGPKTSKLTQPCPWQRIKRDEVQRFLNGDAVPLPPVVDSNNPITCYLKTRRLPVSVFVPVIEAYRTRMYPVWPVIDAAKLSAKLKVLETIDEPDVDLYIMVVALGAATTAQLNLIPMEHFPPNVNSAYMEKQCTQLRALSNYREHPSLEGVLTSFFLHVYHAKRANRNAAMMFLQEAISLARLLRLDRLEFEAFQRGEELTAGEWCNTSHTRLIYLLLWVSERGYGIQCDFPVTISDTIIPPFNLDDFDIYGRGLIELASLFIIFDRSVYSPSRRSYGSSQSLPGRDHLVKVQDSLEKHFPRSSDYDLVQRADYNVTKHWMRILIWQQAMTRGLLSSIAEVDSLTFLFPSRVARDFLSAVTESSKDHLVSLGRDQLVKSFEITNTLADIALCTSNRRGSSSPQEYSYSRSTSPSSCGGIEDRECWSCGPSDYLHALYQNISPFLAHDKKLDDLLRLKAAEALFSVPGRVVPRSLGCELENGGLPNDSEERSLNDLLMGPLSM